MEWIQKDSELRLAGADDLVSFHLALMEPQELQELGELLAKPKCTKVGVNLTHLVIGLTVHIPELDLGGCWVLMRHLFLIVVF